MSQAASGGFDFGGLLAGAGGLASGLGGLFGASSQERAARTARQAQKFNTAYGSNVIGAGLYGLPWSVFQGKLGDAVNEAVAGRPEAYQALLASPEYQQYQRMTGGPLLQQMQNVSRTGIQAGDRLVSDMQGRTNQQAQNDTRIEDMARQQGAQGQANDYRIEQMASMLGAGRRTALNADAERAKRETSRALTMSAAQRGLNNSTVLGSQIAGANTRIDEARNNSINDIADRVLQAQMGAASQGANRQMGRDQNVLNTANYGAARMADRTNFLAGLRQSNIANKDNLRMRPINMQQGANQQIAGMWAGQPVIQSPGTSGLGSALSGIGNTAAMLGAYSLANGGFGGGKPTGGGSNDQYLALLAQQAGLNAF